MASVGDSLDKTEAALFDLGPKAVEVLKTVLDGRGGSSQEVSVARDVLDRMGLHRKGGISGDSDQK